jgi:sporulation protein YlmC with PRC-barrel domain
VGKIKTFLPVLLILVLALSACSSGGSNQGQSATDAAATGVSGIPETGGTPGIPTMEGTSVLGVPTLEGTSVLGGATSEAVPTVEGTIPVTGGTAVGTLESPTSAATTESTSTLSTPVSTAVSTFPAATSAAGTAVPGAGVENMLLSDMLKFQVVDANGDTIGQVRDFVVNMCEARLLYLAVNVQVTGNTGANGVPLVLIPYEALVRNEQGMAPGVSGNAFMVNVNANQLSNAPAFDVTTLDLQNPTWESGVQTFWKQYAKLSVTTGCNVPATGAATSMPGTTGTVIPTTVNTLPGVVGTQPATVGTPMTDSAISQGTSISSGTTGTQAPVVSSTQTTNRVNVTRIALASDLLKADLVEGNGNRAGKVRDAVILPNVGAVYYVIVQPVGQASNSSRQILVPAGAVTIRQSTQGAKGVEVVLLVQNNVLLSAPDYPGDPNRLDQNLYNYWNQYVPMNQSQLP